MNKEQVKRYLDDLLIELEITGNKKTMNKIIKTINHYPEHFDFQEVKKYATKGNQILEKYSKNDNLD